MKTYREELQEFVDICDYMEDMENSLLYKSNMNEDEVYQRLYEKAFSDEINGRLQQIFSFTWSDIDASYKVDYLDWKYGLNDALRSVRMMLER